ncbi:MAG: serine/threonine-protein kinase [Planctomycetota bacterium]
MDPEHAPTEPGPGDRTAAERVEELVFEALGRLEEGGPGALEDFLDAHRDDADELRRRVALLGETGLVAAPAPPPLDVPERVGAFALEEPLGEGGMGVVVAAHDTALDRRVAVKLIRPAGLPHAEARARFEREARAAAALRHPGIVRVFEVGETDGVAWLAMELLAGCTLAEVLDGLRGRRPRDVAGEDIAQAARLGAAASDDVKPAADAWRGPWPEVCARIVRDVAEATHAAHEAGILHRDIKPSNVAVTPHGRVVLLDFGLAHVGDDAQLTRTGAVVGSLPYAPPERVRADAAATELGDVYALGVLLYELLALELPFRAGSRSGLVERIADARPVPVEEANPAARGALGAVVRRAMHAEPERRHRSAADLARDLDDVLAGRPPSAPGRGPFGVLSAWWRARPLEVVGAAAALLSVTAALPLTLRARADATESTATSDARSLERLEVALDAAGTVQAALPRIDALEGSSYDTLRRTVLARLIELRAPLLEAEVGAGLRPLVERARTAQTDARAALAPDATARPDADAARAAADAARLRAAGSEGVAAERLIVQAALLDAQAAREAPVESDRGRLEASLARIEAMLDTTPELIEALRARASLHEELSVALHAAGEESEAGDVAERARRDRARLAASFPGAPELEAERAAWRERWARVRGTEEREPAEEAR